MSWFRSKATMKKKYFEKNGGLILDQMLKSNHKSAKVTKFSSKEIQSATDNFNPARILGGGSDGTVFKGVLANGLEIAVKKLEIETYSDKDVKSFVNEIMTLSQVDHRNIVRLLGCCLETQIPSLIYEFVPRGDLTGHLKDRVANREFNFSWTMRLHILIEISGALTCMHSSDSAHFYHRDVKSANILLDRRYRAKLADFGISRSVNLNQTHVTTQSKGTSAYMDPEFSQSKHYSSKSDVYSFGVVMVDLLTGQIATDMINLQDGSVRSLPAHFLKSLEGNRLWGIVDARVKSEEDRSAIEAVAALAKWCLNQTGGHRPTMRQVGDELERIRLFLG